MLAKTLAHSQLVPSPLGLLLRQIVVKQTVDQAVHFSKQRKNWGPGISFRSTALVVWLPATLLHIVSFPKLPSYATNEDSSLPHMGFWETFVQTIVGQLPMRFLTEKKNLCIYGIHACMLTCVDEGAHIYVDAFCVCI